MHQQLLVVQLPWVTPQAVRMIKNKKGREAIGPADYLAIFSLSFSLLAYTIGIWVILFSLFGMIHYVTNNRQSIVVDLIEKRRQRFALFSQLVGPFAIILLGIIIFLVAYVVVTPMMALQNTIG